MIKTKFINLSFGEILGIAKPLNTVVIIGIPKVFTHLLTIDQF